MELVIIKLALLHCIHPTKIIPILEFFSIPYHPRARIVSDLEFQLLCSIPSATVLSRFYTHWILDAIPLIPLQEQELQSWISELLVSHTHPVFSLTPAQESTSSLNYLRSAQKDLPVSSL